MHNNLLKLERYLTNLFIKFQVVEARKGYVRRVSSIRVQELGASINRLIQNSKKPHSSEPLFECLLVVGLNRDPYTGVYHSYIRDKFPPNVSFLFNLDKFVFIYNSIAGLRLPYISEIF